MPRRNLSVLSSGEDPYTLNRFPRAFAVTIGKQTYNARQLAKAAKVKGQWMDMYRQPIPAAKVREILALTGQRPHANTGRFMPASGLAKVRKLAARELRTRRGKAVVGPMQYGAGAGVDAGAGVGRGAGAGANVPFRYRHHQVNLPPYLHPYNAAAAAADAAAVTREPPGSLRAMVRENQRRERMYVHEAYLARYNENQRRERALLYEGLEEQKRAASIRARHEFRKLDARGVLMGYDEYQRDGVELGLIQHFALTGWDQWIRARYGPTQSMAVPGEFRAELVAMSDWPRAAGLPRYAQEVAHRFAMMTPAALDALTRVPPRRSARISSRR